MEFHDKMFLYGFNYFNNDNLSINEWNKEYGFKILENIKGELKGGKELNQAINRNIDLNQEVNVLDISKSIEGKITKEKVKQKILETITIDFPIARQLTSVGFETVKKKITGKGYYVNGFSFPIMSDLLKDFNKLSSKKEYTLEDFLKGFGVDMTELLTGAPIKTAIRLNKKITGKDLLRN